MIDTNVMEQMVKELAVAHQKREIALNVQLFQDMLEVLPADTEEDRERRKTEQEERKRKVQLELNRRFLGMVVAVEEGWNCITLTYADGHTETIDTGCNDDW